MSIFLNSKDCTYPLTGITSQYVSRWIRSNRDKAGKRVPAAFLRLFKVIKKAWRRRSERLKSADRDYNLISGYHNKLDPDVSSELNLFASRGSLTFGDQSSRRSESNGKSSANRQPERRTRTRRTPYTSRRFREIENDKFDIRGYFVFASISGKRLEFAIGIAIPVTLASRTADIIPPVRIRFDLE